MAEVQNDLENNYNIKRMTLTSLSILLVCALPAVFFGRSTINQVTALHALATSRAPYFVPDHFLLLYGAAPLTTLSACALFLAPGLFVANRFCRPHNLPAWVLSGFTISFAIISIAASLGQGIIGRPLVGADFGWLIFSLAVVTFIFTIGRPRNPFGLTSDRTKGPSIWSPDREDGAALCVAAAMVVVAVIALLPKLFWENFNGDGAHMFETARLMLHQPLPFWPPAAGELTTFPSIKSMLAIYPASWFIRLFGSNEAAVRLPYMLLLPILFYTMIAVIEQGSSRRLRLVELSMLGGALLLFSFVMAFSATEDPYLADLALPPVQDVLLMIFWCGFMLYFLRHEIAPMIGYMTLAYMTSPNALPMFAAWWLAGLICMRPVPRTRLTAVALGIVALVVLEFVVANGLRFVGLPAPGSEHATSDLILRILHPQVSQYVRFAWAFVPVGLVPGIALIMWRWQDSSTRAIALSSLILFAFYYFQYRFALHYFVPVMIISLIVLWRTLSGASGNVLRFALPVTGATTLLCFALSWPSDFHPATGSREVGEEIEDRTTGYEADDPVVFGRYDVIQALFPKTSDPRVPKEIYGGHPLVWLHYAHVPVDKPHIKNYILQWKTAPSIPGAHKIAENDSEAIFVRDEGIRTRQAMRRLPDPTGAPLYFVPRDTLFTNGPHLAILRAAKEFCLRKVAWCPVKSEIPAPALGPPSNLPSEHQ